MRARAPGAAYSVYHAQVPGYLGPRLPRPGGLVRAGDLEDGADGPGGRLRGRGGHGGLVSGRGLLRDRGQRGLEDHAGAEGRFVFRRGSVWLLLFFFS